MRVYFSLETLEVRRLWHSIFWVLKENNCQLRYYIQQKYPSGIKGKSRHSQVKETTLSRPTLKEWLKEVL